MVLQRLFRTASFTPVDQSTQRRVVDPIRRRLHGTLQDCTDLRAQRMTYKINMARTPAELWLLRSDLHQCIAQTHSEGVAAERINALIPVFEGVLPAARLTRI